MRKSYSRRCCRNIMLCHAERVLQCHVLLFSVLSTLTRWLVSSQRLQRLADINNALICRGYCGYCRLPNCFHSSHWQDYPQASSLLSEAVADKNHTMYHHVHLNHFEVENFGRPLICSTLKGMRRLPWQLFLNGVRFVLAVFERSASGKRDQCQRGWWFDQALPGTQGVVVLLGWWTDSRETPKDA